MSDTHEKADLLSEIQLEFEKLLRADDISEAEKIELIRKVLRELGEDDLCLMRN